MDPNVLAIVLVGALVVGAPPISRFGFRYGHSAMINESDLKRIWQIALALAGIILLLLFLGLEFEQWQWTLFLLACIVGAGEEGFLRGALCRRRQLRSKGPPQRQRPR